MTHFDEINGLRTTQEQRARLRKYAVGFYHADWEMVVKVLDDFADLEASEADRRRGCGLDWDRGAVAAWQQRESQRGESR